MAVVDRKSVFRQALTALRYAVAAAVTVVVIMTAMYASVVVARTDYLFVDIVDDYIAVDDQSQPDPKLSFTISADNPSGRVRFYYTGIHCVLSVNDSSTEPYSMEKFDFPDIVVAPDSVQQIGTEANLTGHKLIREFVSNRSSQFDANLTLSGSLTVGVYSVYNKSSVQTTYRCTSVVVGNVSGSAGDTTSWCSIVNNKKRSSS